MDNSTAQALALVMAALFTTTNQPLIYDPKKHGLYNHHPYYLS
jgi:hypothetical protein